MRTKDEILDSARNDITSEHFKDNAPFWMDYRKLEVFIDIRDILDIRLKDIEQSLCDIMYKT